MGRYSAPLAQAFADFARAQRGQQVINVGCGPGALTAELVARMGSANVLAVDPSERLVFAAVRDRHPGVRVQRAAAEALPFDDELFDAALAQLVVHFMADPVLGLREMARVTRNRGIVAACVWDHAGGHGPLGVFWDAAHELDPNIEDESHLAGARRGRLVELLRAAGVHEVEETALVVDVEHPTFAEWWEPFLLGVAPAALWLSSTPADGLSLRDLCRERLRPGAPPLLSGQNSRRPAVSPSRYGGRRGPSRSRP